MSIEDNLGNVDEEKTQVDLGTYCRFRDKVPQPHFAFRTALILCDVGPY